MLNTEPASNGLYHKVPLTNVKVWEPCSESEASEWLPPLDPDEASSKGYPIRPKWLQPPSINRLHVIVQPDGALWPDGCFYLFWCLVVKGLRQSTVANAAGDLADMMNKFLKANMDYNTFRGIKFERPTYYYAAELKLEIARGQLTRKVANRKISNMTGFYKWKVAERGFKPEAEMWKSEIKNKRYVDSFGCTQVKEVITNDLTFKNTESIATGRFIRDGGKLYPIDRVNQAVLLKALLELRNPEMLLAHILSLTTGMRIQSTLTVRHADVIHGIGSDNDANKYALYYMEMGEGKLVETKNGKRQSVAVPAWMHDMLATYTSSKRHQDRAMKSPIRDDDSQYVFLTRTGRPYYISQADQHLFDFSAEAGSAIRQYSVKVHAKLRELGASFTYRFHDLRATFGMNLLEDFISQQAEGKMNQIELLDKLKRRLNHEDINVTLAYLRYREDHPQLAQAQSEFEAHLEDLIRTRMSDNEQARAKNLRT